MVIDVARALLIHVAHRRSIFVLALGGTPLRFAIESLYRAGRSARGPRSYPSASRRAPRPAPWTRRSRSNGDRGVGQVRLGWRLSTPPHPTLAAVLSKPRRLGWSRWGSFHRDTFGENLRLPHGTRSPTGGRRLLDIFRTPSEPHFPHPSCSRPWKRRRSAAGGTLEKSSPCITCPTRKAAQTKPLVACSESGLASRFAAA